MNRKSLVISASSCMLALGLFACGDDVINVENKDVYSTVENIADAECSEENDGAMAFEKSTGTMYVCSEGKWVSVNASEEIKQRCSAETLADSTGYKIVCDGEAIATITNGVNGTNGAAGSAGAAGTAAKEVKVDSLKYAVIDSVKKDLACKVKSSDTDEKTATTSVVIACGDLESEIDLPVLVPNKNLSSVYSKTVFVRFPVVAENACPSGDGDFYTESMPNTAVLNIMEVDGNFNNTGKNFTSEMILRKDEKGLVTYNSVTEESRAVCGYLLRMQGNFNVTNMANSYARVSTTISVRNFGQNWTFENMTFSALVDMDESDTIVLDYLSDFKAARIQNLVAGGESFENASVQANSELATAFGLPEDHKAFDHDMANKFSQEELVVMSLVPFALFGSNIPGESVGAVHVIYNGYRGIFAENGNFNKPLQEKISTENRNQSGAAYYNENAAYLIDFLYNTGYYDKNMKLIQNGFVNTYNLPACNANQKPYVISEVTDGYYSLFYCAKSKSLWEPVNNIAAWYFEDDEFLNSVISEKCTEANKDKSASIQIKDDKFTLICSKDRRNNYYWSVSNSCEGKSEGEFFKGVVTESAGDMPLMVCEYREDYQSKEKVLIPIEVEYWNRPIEYYNRILCTKDTKDTLYSYPNSNYFYVCAANGQTDNNGEAVYAFVKQDPDYSAERQKIVSVQLGECSEENQHATGLAYVSPTDQEAYRFSCYGEYWFAEYDDELPQGLLIKALGACNETVYDEGKVYIIDEDELWNSSNTGTWGYKCEMVGSSSSYMWVEADADETLYGYVCSYRFAGKEISVNGVDLICDGDNWEEITLDSYCSVNRKDFSYYEGRNTNFTKTCKYDGENYIGTREYFWYWYNGSDYCRIVEGSCSLTNGSASSTCTFVYDFDEATQKKSFDLYVCKVDNGSSYGKWVKSTSVEEYCNAYARGTPNENDNCYVPTENENEWDEYRYMEGNWVRVVPYEEWCTGKYGACSKMNVGNECSDYPFDNMSNPVCIEEDDWTADPIGETCSGYDDDECIGWEDVYPKIYHWFSQA